MSCFFSVLCGLGSMPTEVRVMVQDLQIPPPVCSTTSQKKSKQQRDTNIYSQLQVATGT